MDKQSKLEGIFAVYKPKGPSSYDIIRKLKSKTGEKRIGHAGTLDPLASGVLVIGVGRSATKRLAEVVAKEKEYIAVIKLGETSTTDDEEGEKQMVGLEHKPELDEIKQVLEKFTGRIEQAPPIFSAVKLKGTPAYKLARQGKEPKLKPRTVEVKEMEILSFDFPLLKLRLVTGPGVYVRSLARDLGEALGAGGYLADLERVRVGEFTKADAVVLE